VLLGAPLHAAVDGQIVGIEAIIFEYCQNAQIQTNISCKEKPFIMRLRDIESTQETGQRCDQYQDEEAPIPPAIKHITGDEKTDILQLQLSLHSPIKQEDYGQEKQERDRNK
jgi:hypothetical protein